jgi:uncharacterized protein (DUF1330 family)
MWMEDMRMAADRHFVRVMGLQVDDAEAYRRYRAGMMPILQRYGGSFGYDLLVAEVLKSESDKPFNRVFTIRFPSSAQAERFFADTEYLQVRKQHFEPAVSAITQIAVFEETRPG